MSRFWSPAVHNLEPYVAGEQPKIPGLVKLNTNENPFGPSPRVLEAISAASGDRLRLYPDPSSSRLRETLARNFGLEADQVFVGNGSDEVLAFTFAALLKHDKPLLCSDITYSFYKTYARLFEIAVEEVPVDDAMLIHIGDYNRPCGAIILANPNAPTGIALPLSEIEALVASHPDQVVVIDEAYVDFGAETAASLIPHYENLLVVHTFSKSRSLAGLRIGFALGQRPLIEALERMKDSFNSYPLDTLAQAAATAAVEDKAWFQQTRDQIIANRDMVTDALKTRGFEVLPSSANFVFARHPAHQGAELARGLRERAVLVRHFAKPRIGDYLRVTIGTAEECHQFLTAIDQII
ncbi:histidinol-phosphate aminotransferase [Rhizobium sp. Root274]|uniref:histidinol-phosphate transaminase n=1 Tax=unclassified Rhizobium TaxID=2613769 RepID=UPI00071300FE|nr:MULTISPECIES: histidinol-phosphate transaminase [unclassified Rhizobium]KQW28001.1 histidinol-phosphate aminotransferase [Rhizobium sp. Root1240]KRD28285.1 histidinol-phosphate aminotransferase [Rhizobium sp. Root274]